MAQNAFLPGWCKVGSLRPPLQHRGQKKGHPMGSPFSVLCCKNHSPLDKPEVLSPRFFLDFPFVPSAGAAAVPLEQQPADLSLLHVAPLASAEAPDLLQHPADLSLLQVAPLASAEAPDLLQHPAALSLLQDAFLASFEQVCSVLALLSAGASVDWADTVNAKKANAPRKRSFFMRLLSFIRFAGLLPSCERQDTNSLNKSRGW